MSLRTRGCWPAPTSCNRRTTGRLGKGFFFLIAALAAAGCSRNPPASDKSGESLSATAPLAAPETTALVLAAHTLADRARWLGRFDWSDPGGPRFAWSGSAVRFSADARSVHVELEDAGNFFYVLVDGKLHSEKLRREPGKKRYELASGLAPGPHEIVLYRLTEASLGRTKLLSVDLGHAGKLLPPPAASGRRLEIIGDSISTGYGNEGRDEKCNFSPDTQNHYLTYGAIAARELRAELTTIAWSGKGVFSNRGDRVQPMPALYPRTLPQERDSRWNFDLYKPDSVIINLGTNDFAPKNPPEKAFRDAYLGLVEMVREHYPNALIVCALGPLLSDTWPPKEKALSTARRYLRSIVTILHEAGDTNVAFLEFPAQDPKHGLGCDWHPSLKTHELMAQHLSALLRRRLGWK